MTNKKANPAWIYLAIISTVLFIGIALHDVYESDKTVIPEGYVSPEKFQSSLDAKTIEITESKDIIIADKDTIIANLTSQLVGSTIGITNDIKNSLGYLIEGIFLEQDNVNKKFSNRELNLFDGEIEFDNEDYNAEEFFIVSDLKLNANEEDFEGVPYLMFNENSLIYVFEVEEKFTNLIGYKDDEVDHSDETFKFNFLGEEVEVSEWTEKSITFTKGDEIYLDELESKTIGEDEIVLSSVFEKKIYVTVNGLEKRIGVGETAKFGDLEVYVSEIDFKGYSDGRASLIIGEDIKNIIEHQDKYSEDSIWEWVIEQNSIRLRLVENFKDLDEDFKPLADGESICLPNDYVCIRYDSVIETDRETYRFELDTETLVEGEDEVNVISIKGEFEVDLENPSEILIDESGDIWYEDDNYEYVKIGKNIQFTNSDFKLDTTLGGQIDIKDDFGTEALFAYNWDNLNDEEEEVISFADASINNDEDNYLTNFGVLLESPEDSYDGQEFSISVPEERLEATITIL